MKKLTISLLAALSIVTAARAQTVKGRVADSESEPVAGAAVQVYAGSKDPSKLEGYGITDEDGSFSVKLSRPVKSDTHIAEISCIGYLDSRKSFNLDASVNDLGTIILQDDKQMLDNAKVVSQRTLVKMDVDKTSYDVAGDDDSKARTVLEMLRKVPGVTVDGQDNISVNGSGDFKVYVDGKPNQMLSNNASEIFKAMPASAVQRIEVITNPGAKYDAEGTGGVLNLVMHRDSDGQSALPDGMNGSVSAQVDTRGSVQGGLYLNAKKGKFTVGGNLNGGIRNMDGISQSIHQRMDNGMDISSEYSTGQKTPMLFGSLNASYEADSLNLFTASLDFWNWNYRNDGLTGTTAATFGGSPLYSYSTVMNQHGGGTGINASVDWQHCFAGNRERVFTLSYRYSGDPRKSFSESTYSDITGIGLYDRSQDSRDYADEHTVQADFTTPLFSGHSLSAGVKGIFRDNRSKSTLLMLKDGVWQDQYGSNDFNHDNYIAAAYAEYMASVGRFSLKAGLRYEHTFLDVTYLDGSSFSDDYGSLVPNASLQYNIAMNQNIGLSYNLRIRRPGITYLSPFIRRTDPSNISYGNTELDTEKDHSFGLIYNFFNPVLMVNARLNYRLEDGGISDYTMFAPDPEDASVRVMQTTYGNILRTREYGGRVFANLNLGQKTRIYTNLSLAYNIFSSKVLDQENSGWGTNYMVGAQHTFPWDLRLSANLFGSGRHYDLQGWGTGFKGVSLGITRSFLDDALSITLNGFTPLGHGTAAVFEQHTVGDGFSMENSQRVPLGNVGLQIQYSFGKNNYQVKKTSRSISNDDVVNTQNAMEQQSSQTNMQ